MSADELLMRKLMSRLGGQESEEALADFAGSREGAVLTVAILMPSLIALAVKCEFEDAEEARKALAASLSRWAELGTNGTLRLTPQMKKGLSDLLEREGSAEAFGEDIADFAEEAGILDDLVDGTLRKEITDGD